MQVKKIKIVEQMEHSECGLACITMLINYYGNDIKLSTLREEYGVPVEGYTLIKLKEILENKGINATGVSINNINLLNKYHLPFIGLWENKHFVIIEKIKNNRILISDPAIGKRWVDKKTFNEKFSKSALLCNAKENFQKSKSKNEFSHFTSFFYNNRWFIFLLIIITITIQIFNVAIPITIQKTIVYLTLLINSHLNYISFYFDIFILNIFKNSLNDTL